MSRMPTCLLATVVLAMVPTTLSAQRSNYDAGALRLDSRFGDVRIVRGVDGPVVAKIGFFGGSDVARVVEQSPNAVTEAREFQKNYRPGTVVLALGLATLGATVGVSQIHDVDRGVTAGLSIATVGLIAYGGHRLERAYNALARSIWWYNRDLKD
jgi:hypothetical protein